MRNLNIILVFGLSLAFLISSCTKKKPTLYRQEIKPPISANDIPFEQYTFNADSGVVIERPTGTTIKIPASAFINNKGEIVKGNLSLKVREFHSSEDIFRSGIPMSVNNSRSDFLESAGMIELRAFANGDTLELATGKNATISLAAFKNSAGFRLYNLDNSSNWNATDTFSNSSNQRKQIKIDSLNLILSDTLNDVIFDFLTSYNSTPELVPFKGLQWKINKKDLPEDFEDALRINWDDIKITRKGKKFKFDLKLLNGEWGEKKKVFKKLSFVASPIKNGKTLDRNEVNDLSKLNDSVKVQIEQEIARVKKEADLLNTFSINKMGIWNIDKIMNLPLDGKYQVSFDFENEFNSDIARVAVFVILVDENAVIPFFKEDWGKIPFKKGRKMKLKVLLPNNQIALVDENDVQLTISNATDKLNFKTKRIAENQYMGRK
jgi:hypothetical protein